MSQVLCAGILVSDTFCGPMPRLPDAGELLSIPPMKSSAGGCAANVAIDLALQGISVELSGNVGADSEATSLIAELQSKGVGCARIQRLAGESTSRTVILLVEGEDRRYIHDFGANRSFRIEQIERAWLREVQCFYLGGLFVMPLVQIDPLAGLLGYCREKGIATVVDVVIPQSFSAAGSLGRLLPHVDYFLPNSDEAAKLTGCKDPLQQAAALRSLGAANVLITRGAHGLLAATATQTLACGAYTMEEVDPSGAGDAFAAGIITGIVRGWDLPRMLRYASALGASASRAIGTTSSVFTAAQAEAFVAKHQLPIEVIRSGGTA